MDANTCATCGVPRLLEPRRQSVGGNATLHMSQIKPTPGAAESHPQILLVFHAYRNGGTDESTHMCGECARLSLVEIHREISRLLGHEWEPSPDPHLRWR